MADAALVERLFAENGFDVVVNLAAQAGVTLTGAGAAFPYGVDPRDRNLRIAPTYPSLEELGTAVEVLCLCCRLAAAEKLLQDK